jgi:NADH-ubiquinone oxidoreductase chain 1
LFIIFFIASVAETNRAPFDLAEAESELVSGFMTEHAAGIFVFFFLAEYASIILICILITIVLLGGYNIFFIMYILENIFYFFILSMFIVITLLFTFIEFIFSYINYIIYILNIDLFSLIYTINKIIYILYNINKFILEDLLFLMQFSLYLPLNNFIISLLYIFVVGLKTCILIFSFIWVRASYPRIRFDQLMSYCWTVLLPIIISIIVLMPCIIYNKDIIPSIISIL